ncbi:uncharacterized protein EI97DRAFT_445071 [Westerdykella ornata]|uniref:Uncharacterized protein n=1 Tax=Westerdykella ornata TaxID=318751 RepID=A0A6A6J9S1_WESOR|nr:uncharacterized protein EI97DRAFT_445071 [Westerdykella ornata]KAF2273340.1 hypothetical protein EI97DRAFT_445071 [Westerdykella ornata]
MDGGTQLRGSRVHHNNRGMLSLKSSWRMNAECQLFCHAGDADAGRRRRRSHTLVVAALVRRSTSLFYSVAPRTWPYTMRNQVIKSTDKEREHLGFLLCGNNNQRENERGTMRCDAMRNASWSRPQLGFPSTPDIVLQTSSLLFAFASTLPRAPSVSSHLCLRHSTLPPTDYDHHQSETNCSPLPFIFTLSLALSSSQNNTYFVNTRLSSVIYPPPLLLAFTHEAILSYQPAKNDSPLNSMYIHRQ